MVFIITLNCAVIKDEVAEVKAERLDTVDTVGCGTLVTEEATTGHGGTAVTVVVDAEVIIANRDGQLKKKSSTLCTAVA